MKPKRNQVLEKLKEAPSRESSEVAREAPRGSIDRKGGRYGAGKIEAVSMNTRGEAAGHGYWLDKEFVESVGDSLEDAGDGGIKARFKHPGLSSDGLGTTLGRFTNPQFDGDRVLGDLDILESAHETPEGNLAEYVMNMADESPDLFGTSIVFKQDYEATKAHAIEHGAEMKEGLFGPYLDLSDFESPDPENTDNLPHARLTDLRACDVVDEPAANPDGFFSALSAEGQMVEGFESVLSYALGLSDEAPPQSDLIPVHPDRLRGFFSRFCEARGLRLGPALVDTDTVSTATEPLKAMLETRKQLKEKLEAQAEEITRLESQVEDLTAEKEDAEGRVQEAADELTEAKATITRLEEESAEKQTLIEAADAKLEEADIERTELEAKAEETEEKVAEAAAAELATIGVEPAEEVATAEADGPLPRKEFNEIYNSIEDSRERSQWFLDNKHRLAE